MNLNMPQIKVATVILILRAAVLFFMNLLFDFTGLTLFSSGPTATSTGVL